MPDDDTQEIDREELEAAYYAAMDEAVRQRAAEHAQMGTDLAEMEANWRALGRTDSFPF